MNVFKQVGCVEDSEYEGLYYHTKLPFNLCEHNGMLEIRVNLEYRLDEGKIPLTVENLQRLIDSFNPLN